MLTAARPLALPPPSSLQVPELNVQNGVLKALSFLFEYIGEMGKDYIYAGGRGTAGTAGTAGWFWCWLVLVPVMIGLLASLLPPRPLTSPSLPLPVPGPLSNLSTYLPPPGPPPRPTLRLRLRLQCPPCWRTP